jgi:hypothetical protein
MISLNRLFFIIAPHLSCSQISIVQFFRYTFNANIAKVFVEPYRSTMKGIINKVGYDYDIDIVELEIPNDHIHMVIRGIPKQSPGKTGLKCTEFTEIIMATTSISKAFGSLTDPRIDRTKRHPLINILTISICAIIAGCDDFQSISEYGKSKKSALLALIVGLN